MTIRKESSAIKHVVLGTGPLGRATANALAVAGHQVEMVNRSGFLENAPAGIAIIPGDLGDLDSLRSVVEGAAAIYFCAQPPYHRWTQEFPALQVSAITLAEEAGARLIVAENLYGYGRVIGPMTEDLPMQPNSRKGQVRAAMHEQLMEAHRAGRVQVAVARGSDFFGPHVDGSAAGARAFRAVVAQKSVEHMGDIDTLHSYTYVMDFGKAMAILGSDPRSLGEVWHVPNAPTVSTRAFFSFAFDHAQAQPKFRKVSLIELKLLGLLVPPLRETIEMRYAFDHPFVVNHDKFANMFGDISTPHENAVGETVSWTKDGYIHQN